MANLHKLVLPLVCKFINVTLFISNTKLSHKGLDYQMHWIVNLHEWNMIVNHIILNTIQLCKGNILNNFMRFSFANITVVKAINYITVVKAINSYTNLQPYRLAYNVIPQILWNCGGYLLPIACICSKTLYKFHAYVWLSFPTVNNDRPCFDSFVAAK